MSGRNLAYAEPYSSPARARKRALENMYIQGKGTRQSPDERDDRSVDSIEALVKTIEAKGYDLSRGGNSFYSVNDESDEDTDDRYKIVRNATSDSWASKEPALHELPVYRSPTPPRRKPKQQTLHSELSADVNLPRNYIIETVISDDIEDESFASESSSMYSWRRKKKKKGSGSQRRRTTPTIREEEVSTSDVQEREPPPTGESSREGKHRRDQLQTRELSPQQNEQLHVADKRHGDVHRPRKEPPPRKRPLREPPAREPPPREPPPREPPPRAGSRKEKSPRVPPPIAPAARAYPPRESPPIARAPPSSEISNQQHPPKQEPPSKREPPPPERSPRESSPQQLHPPGESTSKPRQSPNKKSQTKFGRFPKLGRIIRRDPIPAKDVLLKGESKRAVPIDLPSPPNREGSNRESPDGELLSEEPLNREPPNIATSPPGKTSRVSPLPPSNFHSSTSKQQHLAREPVSYEKHARSMAHSQTIPPPQVLPALHPVSISPPKPNLNKIRADVFQRVLHEEESVISDHDASTLSSDGSSTYDVSLYSEESSFKRKPRPPREQGVFDQIFSADLDLSDSDSLQSSMSGTVYSDASDGTQKTHETSLWGDIVDEVRDLFPWNKEKASKAEEFVKESEMADAPLPMSKSDEESLESERIGSGLSLTDVGANHSSNGVYIAGAAVGSFPAVIAASHAPMLRPSPEGAVGETKSDLIIQASLNQGNFMSSQQMTANNGAQKSTDGMGAGGCIVIPGKKASLTSDEKVLTTKPKTLRSLRQFKQRATGKSPAKVNVKVRSSKRRKKVWRTGVATTASNGLESIREREVDSAGEEASEASEASCANDEVVMNRDEILEAATTKGEEEPPTWLNSPHLPLAALAAVASAGEEMFAFASHIVEGGADNSTSISVSEPPKIALTHEAIVVDDATTNKKKKRALFDETTTVASEKPSSRKHQFGLVPRKANKFESIFVSTGSTVKEDVPIRPSKRRLWSLGKKPKPPSAVAPIVGSGDQVTINEKELLNKSSQVKSLTKRGQTVVDKHDPSLFPPRSLPGIASFASLGSNPTFTLSKNRFDEGRIDSTSTNANHDESDDQWCVCGDIASSDGFEQVKDASADNPAKLEVGHDDILVGMCHNNVNELKLPMSKEETIKDNRMKEHSTMLCLSAAETNTSTTAEVAMEHSDVMAAMRNDNVHQQKASTLTKESSKDTKTKERGSTFCSGPLDATEYPNATGNAAIPNTDTGFLPSCFGASAAALGATFCFLASGDPTTIELGEDPPTVQDPIAAPPTEDNRKFLSRFRKSTKEKPAAPSGKGASKSKQNSSKEGNEVQGKPKFSSRWKKSDGGKTETTAKAQPTAGNHATKSAVAERSLTEEEHTKPSGAISGKGEQLGSQVSQSNATSTTETYSGSKTETSGGLTQDTKDKSNTSLLRAKVFRFLKPRSKKKAQKPMPLEQESVATNADLTQQVLEEVESAQMSEGVSESAFETEISDSSSNSATGMVPDNETTEKQSTADEKGVTESAQAEEPKANIDSMSAIVVACLVAPFAFSWFSENSKEGLSVTQKGNNTDENKSAENDDEGVSFFDYFSTYCTSNSEPVEAQRDVEIKQLNNDAMVAKSMVNSDVKTVEGADSHMLCFAAQKQEEDRPSATAAVIRSSKNDTRTSIPAETKQQEDISSPSSLGEKKAQNEATISSENETGRKGVEEKPSSELFCSAFPICDSPEASDDSEADSKERKTPCSTDERKPVSHKTEAQCKKLSKQQAKSDAGNEKSVSVQSGAACGCATSPFSACFVRQPQVVPSILSEETTGSVVDGAVFWQSITSPTKKKQVSSSVAGKPIVNKQNEKDSSHEELSGPFNPCVSAICCPMPSDDKKKGTRTSKDKGQEDLRKLPGVEAMRSKLRKVQSGGTDVSSKKDAIGKQKFWKKTKRKEIEPLVPPSEGVLAFMRQVSMKMTGHDDDDDDDSCTRSVSSQSIMEIKKAIKVVKRQASRVGLSEKEFLDVLGESRGGETDLIQTMGQMTEDFFDGIENNLSYTSKS